MHHGSSVSPHLLEDDKYRLSQIVWEECVTVFFSVSLTNVSFVRWYGYTLSFTHGMFVLADSGCL